ncbi:DUF3667 domain-containing protein [Pontimicrobium sp. IMCC45349]|uniref:DUF3667 domain-containing protein n=1 Tax=Pontimicrobium sp. IMCC45349 TaxID=3391574 RepID=UPI0039A24AB7
MSCKNCHNDLTTKDDFCNLCGAKVIRNRLTFKNLFRHVIEHFFSYDNKFLKTVIGLIKMPEDVIGSYVEGTRKKYVNPISLFAISLTFSGLSIFIIQKFFLETAYSSTIFKFDNPVSERIMEQTPKIILEYNSLFFAILIPFLAIISLIVFYDKKYNYTEHLVVYLYTMSFSSIISVLVGFMILAVDPSSYMNYGMSFNFLNIIFHCYVLKRLFKLSTGELALKIMLFFGVSFILYIILSIAIVLLLFATGVINLQDFVPPS